MIKLPKNQITLLRILIILLFTVFLLCSSLYPRFVAKSFGSGGNTAVTAFVVSEIEPEATPTPRRRRQTTGTQTAKYSQFPHNIQAHKTACNTCHKFPSPNWKTVRKGDAAFPDITDYPRHESCLDCHKQQFFRGNPPQICTICHTNPGPQNSDRHPFPNPREIFDLSKKGQTAVSDFEIFFPHDKHIDIVSENKIEGGVEFSNASFSPNGGKRQESCAVCHQTYQPQGESPVEFVTNPPAKLGDAFWLKKGTFKTVPIGHTQCFTCHSEDSGMTPAPTDCATCHKLKTATEWKTDFDPKVAVPMQITDKIILHAWRKRDSSATFRHEFSSHADMECATCHNAAAINTLDPLTKKVKVGSCAPCHITATSDDGGILNFEIDARKKDAKFQCAKCHIAYGKSPIPESHNKAITDAQ